MGLTVTYLNAVKRRAENQLARLSECNQLTLWADIHDWLWLIFAEISRQMASGCTNAVCHLTSDE